MRTLRLGKSTGSLWNITEFYVFHSNKIQFKIIQRKLVCSCALCIRRKEEKVLVESRRICRRCTPLGVHVRQWFTMFMLAFKEFQTLK